MNKRSPDRNQPLQEALRRLPPGALQPEQILPQQWRDPAFLNNLGAALYNAGHPEAALAAYDLAGSLDSRSVHIPLNRATALAALGRLDEAAAACRAALALDGDAPDAQARYGEVLLQAGDVAGALPWLQRAVAAGAAGPQAAINLSAALIRLKRPADAAQVCAAGLAAHPSCAALWANQGSALLELSRPDEAAAAFGQATNLDPAAVRAWLGLGSALERLGQLQPAAQALEAAIAHGVASAPLHHRLGTIRLKLGQTEQAVAACRAAIDLHPDYAPAYIGLGAALRRIDRRAEAAEAYRSAIALDPDSAMAHYNLANVLQELDDDPAADAAYARAIALRPDWPSAHYNYGLWLLKHGRYAEGWEQYEWRWRTESFKDARRDFPAPQWTGQPLDGATVLVHAEQGLGDLIQFARFIPMLAARGARVLLETPGPLKALFAPLGGVAERLDPGAPAPPYDYHCPYLSLPHGFHTALDTIPADIPYLRADAGRAAVWRDRLPPGLRVGVAWQGNPVARVEQGRSFALTALAPLARTPGMRLISLQKGHGLEQLKGPGFEIATLGEDFDRGDFAETAAVIANLDLVIACDTAVGHLAGALGKPVWLAVKVDNDWRWLTGRSDSPWYPTLRLYRQARRADWSDVFAAMARDLADQALK